jgi:glycosyltransferase 2 family protein
MKKILAKSVLGIAIGVFFMYITLNNKPLDQIFTSLKDARLNWMVISSFGLIFIFFLRALRWKILLESSNTYPGNYNVMYSLMVGYFVNSFTPKLGEIIRCTTLKSSENIPTSISFGTVVSERIYDILVLFSGLFIIFLFEIDRLGYIINSIFIGMLNLFSKNAYTGIAIAIIIFVAIYVLFYFSKKNAVAAKAKVFVLSMMTSLKLSLKMRQYKKFILLTFFIWTALVFVNFSFLMSLTETNSFGIYFAFLVLFIGSVGWVVPSPSGLGTSNFMILQLFIAFSLNEQDGVSFGLLVSGITFLVTVSLGAIAILFHFLRQKKFFSFVSRKQ